MDKKIFQSKSIPATKAPYSQAVVYDSLLFVSGQVAYDPKMDRVIKGTIEEETEVCLSNLKDIIEEAGSSLKKVLKVSVYLAEIGDFERFNDVYRKFFVVDPPARSCVGVAQLPFGAKVEIDAIAYIQGK